MYLYIDKETIWIFIAVLMNISKECFISHSILDDGYKRHVCTNTCHLKLTQILHQYIIFLIDNPQFNKMMDGI